MSIKSVGFLLGLNMLVILRCYHFETAEQAAVFPGVVPVEKNSGTSIRGQGDKNRASRDSFKTQSGIVM
ncbi:transposase [Escherichia coli]|uniref:transposase n=2 Tax=Escherichia coli TaxID=562 RepID=UPI0028831A34|nr:transposase [Escherichia coli]HCJ6080062.1 transposase [Escherichia coli]